MSILALDLGAKRIGVAVSDSGVLATPHSVLANEGDIIEKVARLGEQLEAETFVVGIPKRAVSGPSEGKFHDFADRLRQRPCKQVALWDESRSTGEASERPRAAGRGRRDAQRTIDMQAAAVILQSYLDDLARRMS